jgi:hypothetical protein
MGSLRRDCVMPMGIVNRYFLSLIHCEFRIVRIQDLIYADILDFPWRLRYVRNGTSGWSFSPL